MENTIISKKMAFAEILLMPGDNFGGSQHVCF